MFLSKTPQRSRFTWLRLTLGISFFILALLTVIPAPTYLFWELAILATEWGHVLAVLSLLLLLPGWQRSRINRIAATLGLMIAILALTPIIRAIPVAQSLPEKIKLVFGASQPLAQPNAPSRPKPLVAVDLWRRVDSPEVRSSSLIYSKIEDKVLRLDFYMPPRIYRPAPCVVVIHGGYWRAGDSQQLAPLNTYLAARGYAVAAINYRLVPRWPFPAARDDVIAALAYLKARADSLHLDPQRFVLLGRSAGGQLALLVAYTQHDPAIRGVVSFYGPTDMHWSYANPSNPLIVDSRAVLEAYLSGNPVQTPANYDAASPLRFIDANTPPTLLIHGGRDELVFFRQSERLAERLAQAGAPYFLLCLPWATHGFDFNFSGPGSQISTYTIERFLAAVMKSE